MAQTIAVWIKWDKFSHDFGGQFATVRKNSYVITLLYSIMSRLSRRLAESVIDGFVCIP